MTHRPTDEILRMVDERKAQLDALRPLPAITVTSLRDKLALDWTYNSNAIEGNTLSLRETKVVLEHGITIGQKTMREHFEAINHREAIHLVEDLVSRQVEISPRSIRDIHSLVLRNIDDQHAGRYRTGNVVITGASFTPPANFHLEDRMTDLDRWYRDDGQALHPIERAAQLHTRFVEIHPFEDGNGRTARLLLNLELMRSGYPIAVIRTEDRLAYYDVLDKACTERDYSGFTRMVAEAVSKSQDLYLEVVTGHKPAPLDFSVGASPSLPTQPGTSLSLDRHAYKQALGSAGAPVWQAEQARKAVELEGLKGMATGALLTFAEIATDAIRQAGDGARVNWRAVEDAAIAKSLQEDRQPADDVYRAIAGASPGTMTEPQKAALRARIDRVSEAQAAPHPASPEDLPAPR